MCSGSYCWRNEMSCKGESSSGARRSCYSGNREPDDEGAQALHSVTNDLAMANMEREVRTLAEIELSLRRIEAGEYGICGSCEERIPEARLRALPWTRLCVHCAGGGVGRREERHERPFLVKSSAELASTEHD